ncbi:MAG: hypothetical protein ACP5I1_19930, partial [Candidatus Hinthialibacter sp.]
NYIYDFIGMLGLPLKPAIEIDPEAPAVFLPFHSLHDEQLTEKLEQMLADQKPVLVTNHLAEKLPSSLKKQLDDSMILDVPEDLWDLMNLPENRLRSIRNALLKPFGLEFDAPTRVALYMFSNDIYGIENFNNKEIKAVLKKKSSKTRLTTILTLPEQNNSLSVTPGQAEIAVPARGLIIFKMN